MNRLTQFAITALLLALAYAPALSQEPNHLEAALNELGLEERDLTPDPYAVLLKMQERDALPIVVSLRADPLKAGYRLGLLDEELLEWSHSPHRQLVLLGNLYGAGIARGAINNPWSGLDRVLAVETDPLTAILRGNEALDATSNVGLEDVPDPWRLEIARLISLSISVDLWWDRAYGDFPLHDPQALVRHVIDGAQPQAWRSDWRIAHTKTRKEAMLALALDAAMMVEDFVAFARQQSDPPPFLFTADTSLGKLRVSTERTSDTLTDGPYFLNLDWWGNDQYGPGLSGGGPDNPVSVLIDWHGDDVYLGDDEGNSPGRGVLGVGLLWDEQGDDLFQGQRIASASALFGVSVLIDEAGNDRHEAGSYAQGSAIGGVALLRDGGGDDIYTAVSHSQGSAGPQGVALLLDLAGSDQYLMAPESVIHPAAQNPQRNGTLGQGFGWGRRGDLSDGLSLAGGLGLLIDASGNDSYAGQVFAQGSGFFGGGGVLIDREGNDRYSATYYALGSGAHQSVGLLLDRAGDDTYALEQILGLGGAQDDSAGVFADLSGNDSYIADEKALGHSNENSFGLFLDAAGNDSYILRAGSNHRSFGQALLDLWGTSREAALGLGLFFDLGGEDEYHLPPDVTIGNDRSWRGAQRYPGLDLKSELGFGIDAEGGEMPLYFGARTIRGAYARRLHEDALRQRQAFRE